MSHEPFSPPVQRTTAVLAGLNFVMRFRDVI